MGIDHIDPLINDSIQNCRNDPAAGPLLEKGTLKLVVGDGRKGYQPSGPYDVIHVGAAAPEIPPDVSWEKLLHFRSASLFFTFVILKNARGEAVVLIHLVHRKA